MLHIYDNNKQTTGKTVAATNNKSTPLACLLKFTFHF